MFDWKIKISTKINKFRLVLRVVTDVASEVEEVRQSLAALFGFAVTDLLDDAFNTGNGVELKFAVDDLVISLVTDEALGGAVGDGDGAVKLALVLLGARRISADAMNSRRGFVVAGSVDDILGVDAGSVDGAGSDNNDNSDDEDDEGQKDTRHRVVRWFLFWGLESFGKRFCEFEYTFAVM